MTTFIKEWYTQHPPTIAVKPQVCKVGDSSMKKKPKVNHSLDTAAHTADERSNGSSSGGGGGNTTLAVDESRSSPMLENIHEHSMNVDELGMNSMEGSQLLVQELLDEDGGASLTADGLDELLIAAALIEEETNGNQSTTIDIPHPFETPQSWLDSQETCLEGHNQQATSTLPVILDKISTIDYGSKVFDLEFDVNATVNPTQSDPSSINSLIKHTNVTQSTQDASTIAKKFANLFDDSNSSK